MKRYHILITKYRSKFKGKFDKSIELYVGYWNFKLDLKKNQTADNQHTNKLNNYIVY